MSKVKSIEDYLSMPYTIEMVRDTDGQISGWVAKVAEFPGCMTQVDRLDELEEAITDAMRAWLETAIEQNYPIPEPRQAVEYSGKFVVRVPKSLHRDLVKTADAEGVSLNQFITSALARAVGEQTGLLGSRFTYELPANTVRIAAEKQTKLQ